MFIHRSSNDSPHPPALPNLAPQEDQLYTWGANANGQLGPLGFHPIHPMKKWMTGGIPVVGNIHIIHKYIYIYISSSVQFQEIVCGWVHVSFLGCPQPGVSHLAFLLCFEFRLSLEFVCWLFDICFLWLQLNIRLCSMFCLCTSYACLLLASMAFLCRTVVDLCFVSWSLGHLWHLKSNATMKLRH